VSQNLEFIRTLVRKCHFEKTTKKIKRSNLISWELYISYLKLLETSILSLFCYLFKEIFLLIFKQLIFP